MIPVNAILDAPLVIRLAIARQGADKACMWKGYAAAKILGPSTEHSRAMIVVMALRTSWLLAPGAAMCSGGDSLMS